MESPLSLLEAESVSGKGSNAFQKNFIILKRERQQVLTFFFITGKKKEFLQFGPWLGRFEGRGGKGSLQIYQKTEWYSVYFDIYSKILLKIWVIFPIIKKIVHSIRTIVRKAGTESGGSILE